MRRAVNHIADAELDIVARRLTDDARANDLTYERQGVLEPVRVMLRPLLIMPEQQSYLHHVCTRVSAEIVPGLSIVGLPSLSFGPTFSAAVGSPLVR